MSAVVNQPVNLGGGQTDQQAYAVYLAQWKADAQAHQQASIAWRQRTEQIDNIWSSKWRAIYQQYNPQIILAKKAYSQAVHHADLVAAAQGYKLSVTFQYNANTIDRIETQEKINKEIAIGEAELFFHGRALKIMKDQIKKVYQEEWVVANGYMKKIDAAYDNGMKSLDNILKSTIAAARQSLNKAFTPWIQADNQAMDWLNLQDVAAGQALSKADAVATKAYQQAVAVYDARVAVNAKNTPSKENLAALAATTRSNQLIQAMSTFLPIKGAGDITQLHASNLLTYQISLAPALGH
ncbi:MAG: hypothetical protein ACYCSZ_01940 [Burkholderiales bacterium]